jgi:hypothetical protein
MTILLLGFSMWFAFRQGKRALVRKEESERFEKAELEAGPMLFQAEKLELERHRKAIELDSTEIPNPVEMEGREVAWQLDTISRHDEIPA